MMHPRNSQFPDLFRYQTSPLDVQFQIGLVLASKQDASPFVCVCVCVCVCVSCILFRRPIASRTSPKMRRPVSKRTFKSGHSSPISKLGGVRFRKKWKIKRKKGSLQSVCRALVRPLGRAAGTGAKVPLLAARPGILWVFAALYVRRNSLVQSRRAAWLIHRCAKWPRHSQTAVKFSIGYFGWLYLSKAGLCVEVCLNSRCNHSTYAIEGSTEYSTRNSEWLYLSRATSCIQLFLSSRSL